MEKEIINNDIPEYLQWDIATSVSEEPGEDILSQEYTIDDDPEIEESSKGILNNYYKLTEAFQAQNFIKKEIANAGGLDNLSLSDLVNKIEDIADTGKEIPDHLLSRQGLYNFISRMYKDVDLSKLKAQVRRNGEAPVEKKEFNPDELEGAAKTIFDAYVESEDNIKNIEENVNEKYDDIYYAVKGVAQGKSIKRHALLYGAPGCGKTFMIVKALKEVFGDDYSGTNGKGQKCVRINGNIGTSKSAVIAFFYENRNNKVIFLDDCDGFLLEKDQNIQNTLKGMLDPDNTVANPIPIHVPASICSLVNKYLGLNGGKPMKEGSNYLDPLNLCKNKLKEDEDIDLSDWEDDEDELAGWDDESDEGNFVDDEEPISTDNFEFHSALILASNLNRKDINPAVLSRCESIELNLTHEEFLYRLKSVLPHMKTNSDVDIPAEVQSYIYGVVFTYLSAILTIAEKGGTLFGKGIQVNRNLEFRLIPELASKYQRCLDIYISKNNIDGPVKEVYQKSAKAVEKTFISKFLIPTLQTA